MLDDIISRVDNIVIRVDDIVIRVNDIIIYSGSYHYKWWMIRLIHTKYFCEICELKIKYSK